jgi:hypothetical protein
MIAEVTLEYPKTIHKEHKSFPLCPVNATVYPEQLSPYQKKCHELLGTKPSKVQKLIADFNPREKYVIHAANLQLYLSLGMILKSVHRVLGFEEESFLQIYIDFCTEMRSKAKNPLESNFFKLLSNCIYGKFIEAVMNYMDVKFCYNKKQALKWTSNPRFLNYIIISKDLTAVLLQRKSVVCKQAYAIGFTILELSKHFMYDSYYNFIKPKLRGCNILMSDTDSLFLECKTKKPFERIKRILDTSNFDPNHHLHRLDRKSKLGFFKSETSNNLVQKFIGLRSKCYAFKTTKNEQSFKCKGVVKAYRKGLTMDVYQKCIDEISRFETKQRSLVSKNHVIQLQKRVKLAFTSYDDKFFLLDCGIHTRPYGHYKNCQSHCQICERK